MKTAGKNISINRNPTVPLILFSFPNIGKKEMLALIPTPGSTKKMYIIHP